MSRFDPLNGYIECIFIVGNESVALMVGYNVSIIIFSTSFTSFCSSRSTEAGKILERFIVVKRGSTISDHETDACSGGTGRGGK